MTTSHKPSADPKAPATSHSQAKAQHLAKCGNEARHEEGQLDTAVDQTFPASDPVAEVASAAPSVKVIDSEDRQLDKAIEMTFPASDPIAVSNITKIVPDEIKPVVSHETAPAKKH